MNKIFSDLDKCFQAVRRGIEISKKADGDYANWVAGQSKLQAWMDISAAHRAQPLDLDRWLAADDFNFMHDLIGIHSHINRETKKIDNAFLPRFAILGDSV